MKNPSPSHIDALASVCNACKKPFHGAASHCPHCGKNETEIVMGPGQAFQFSASNGQLETTYHGVPVWLLFTAAVESEKIMARLTPEAIAYAGDTDRGEYQGFAALHDLCDANMLLPGAEYLPADSEAITAFWNAVQDIVSKSISFAWKARPDWTSTDAASIIDSDPNERAKCQGVLTYYSETGEGITITNDEADDARRADSELFSALNDDVLEPAHFALLRRHCLDESLFGDLVKSEAETLAANSLHALHTAAGNLISAWDQYDETGPRPLDSLVEELRAALNRSKGEALK